MRNTTTRFLRAPMLALYAVGAFLLIAGTALANEAGGTQCAPPPEALTPGCTPPPMPGQPGDQPGQPNFVLPPCAPGQQPSQQNPCRPDGQGKGNNPCQGKPQNQGQPQNPGQPPSGNQPPSGDQPPNGSQPPNGNQPPPVNQAQNQGKKCPSKGANPGQGKGEPGGDQGDQQGGDGQQGGPQGGQGQGGPCGGPPPQNGDGQTGPPSGDGQPGPSSGGSQEPNNGQVGAFSQTNIKSPCAPPGGVDPRSLRRVWDMKVVFDVASETDCTLTLKRVYNLKRKARRQVVEMIDEELPCKITAKTRVYPKGADEDTSPLRGDERQAALENLEGKRAYISAKISNPGAETGPTLVIKSINAPKV